MKVQECEWVGSQSSEKKLDRDEAEEILLNMDQTIRGRACEQELRRWADLAQNFPTPKDSHDTNPFLIYEDEPDCDVDVISLLSGVHPIVDKCTLVFATLALQIDKLLDEAHNVHFPKLMLYDENATSNVVHIVDGENGLLSDAEVIRQMAVFFPALQDVSLFLGRVYQVFRNMIQQLRAFYALSASELADVKGRRLDRSWRALGDLLAILMQVDEVMMRRHILKRDWQVYRRSIEAAQHSASQFDVSSEQLRHLQTTFVAIDAQLMHGDALLNCYEQSFGELDDDVQFRELMKKAIIELYSRWEETASTDVPDKRQLTVIVCLAVFHHLHFGGKEKKVAKTVWQSHKKIVAFHLVGDVVWFPCVFLLREITELPDLVDKKSVQFVLATKSVLYTEQGVGMIGEAHSLSIETAAWCSLMRRVVTGSQRTAADCLQAADVILKGARLCDTMSRLLRTVLNSESGERKMTRADSGKIIDTVVAIKTIARVFAQYWSTILEICLLAAHQWRCHALSIVDRGRASCRENGANDRLSALDTASEALMGTDSRARLLVAGIALEMAVYKKTLKSGEPAQLEQLLTRMDTIGRPRRLISRVTDCSFLFWERSLFHIYFDTLIELRPSRDDVEAFFLAATDSAFLASQAVHVGSGEMLRRFQKELFHSMQKGVLYVMCCDIESDLRVLTHKHLSVDEKDKATEERIAFYKTLLAGPNLRIYDRVLDVKDFVQRYLERTFYNLTVVALHDRHTYAKMSSLAAERFGLKLVDGHLPHFSLDQGLDVIVVMRNLNKFVASYNYSLNQQIFIEKDSSSKSLQILTSEHVANSLRSHGIGVLNTSVNVTYQLLKKKFAIFSQFLAEEHVRAQLQREKRYFDDNAEAIGRMFPVKRAEKFNRAIVKLGLDGEESCLDKFRELVTQIGNALGIVRALTSAAGLVASQQKEYDCLEDLPNDLVSTPGQPVEIYNVVRDLLAEMRDQTNRNRNYINMLISVFRQGFLDESKFAHVNNFYMIVPPLTVNYVEHMLTCRERLRKRAQHGKQITFTDDGFVMGIAYLCTVLQQWRPLSALNWFTSVLTRCAEERSRFSEDLSMTQSLKEQRLTAFEREFKLLSYTLQSARIFFFSDTDEEHLVT